MNTPRCLVLVVAAVLAACAGGKPAPAPTPAPPAPAATTADFRATPPPLGPTPSIEVPVPARRELANGLTVLVVPRRDLPLLSARVVFKSGSATDPEALPGVAGFVGDLLRSGTKTRKAQAIADLVETQGSQLAVDVDEDSLIVGASALAANFAPVFDVVAEVVQASTFPPEEIERARKRRLAALAEEVDDPESLAARVTRAVVFGKHPYGHTTLGDEQSVTKIARADLVAWAERHLRPANAAVVLVGDIDPEQAFAEVEKRFGGWKGAPGANPAPPVPKPQPPDVVLVPKPDAPQSQVRLAELGIARVATPDYFATLVMNYILGGMFNSRINMNLREAKGYTYGAYSYFDPARAPGIFVVGAGVRTDVTASALKEALAEIDGIRDRDVTDDELTSAKNAYSLSLPARFQTIGGIASMNGIIYVYDLPLDYYRQLPGRIQAVSKDDVRRAAMEHVIPDQLSIIVVGDPLVRQGLEGLQRGAADVRRPDGKPAAAGKP